MHLLSILSLTLVNGFSFEYSIAQPRHSLVSYTPQERQDYLGKINLLKSRFTSDEEDPLRTNLMDALAMSLYKMPMDFQAYPAWTSKFLNYTENLIQAPIPYWDWTELNFVWMFAPPAPQGLPLPASSLGQDEMTS
ncbi:hypothetical protein DSO57_1011474 [Entomophthora muscae]|uniref:Uncharacterized protein n=1 Tax=Entomophthora muscae TaxID=34485 RepID=A0ACC2RXF2_9FUNG|nr:hypothetical protein DSO57_1011474 [Entomophthora muscae]